MYRTVLPLVWMLVLYACEQDRTRLASPDTSAVAPTGPASSVDTLRITGPSVLAFFATIQAEVEQSDGALEALADFQYYLPPVRDSVGKRGVALHESCADTLLILRETGSERFLPRQHQAPVGYVLFAPGRTPRIEYGVMTDSDLLAVASEYFAW